MREIKFRAYDTEIGKMHYDFEKAADELGETAFDLLAKEFSNIVLMQFTGLKDKNGKEIYEGDIVNDGTGFNAEVKWIDLIEPDKNNYLHGWILDYGNAEIEAIIGTEEVIGNIYENLELLKAPAATEQPSQIS